MLLNTGEQIVRSEHGLLTTVCYQFGDAPAVYALEGSIAVTGSAVQWLRDQLGIIATAAEVERLAQQVDDNGGVYFVPAFSGLFAPYWRSDARGAIVGLSRFDTKAHIARATLEAICYQSRDVADAMAAGLRRRPRGAQGRRRRHRQRLLHAAAGRHPRRAGQPAGRGRDDGPGRGLRRRAGGRLLGRPGRAARPTGTSRSAGHRSGTRTGEPRGTPGGARPSSAPWAGSTSTDPCPAWRASTRADTPVTYDGVGRDLRTSRVNDEVDAAMSTKQVQRLDRVVIRFAGDSGDGMQLTGDRFTSETAVLGNDLSTLPNFPAEIRAPQGTLPGRLQLPAALRRPRRPDPRRRARTCWSR